MNNTIERTSIRRTFDKGRVCACGNKVQDDKHQYQMIRYVSCVDDSCSGLFECTHEKLPPDEDDVFDTDVGMRSVNDGDPYDQCDQCDEYESLRHSEHDYS